MSIPSEPYRCTLIGRCSYCPPLGSGLSRLMRMDPGRWARFITRCGVRNVAWSWCIWRELKGLLYDICIYRLRLGVRRLFAPCAEILNSFYCLCLAAPLKYRCFPFLSSPIRLTSITEPFPEGDSYSSLTPETDPYIVIFTRYYITWLGCRQPILSTSYSDSSINYSTIYLIYCNHARLNLRIQQVMSPACLTQLTPFYCQFRVKHAL